MKLAGKIALVAGATRGAGRAIAVALGDAGATVICTGRSTRATRPAAPVQQSTAFVLASGPETSEDTADLVTGRGGRGVAIRVEHTVTAEVEALATRKPARPSRPRESPCRRISGTGPSRRRSSRSC